MPSPTIDDIVSFTRATFGPDGRLRSRKPSPDLVNILYGTGLVGQLEARKGADGVYEVILEPDDDRT